MQRVVDFYFLALKAIIAALLALMVAMVFGNVVLRYGFNSGITVSEELARWSFVWLVFLGAIVALREHQHLGMDFIVRALPRPGRIACHVVSHILMLYATWLFFWGSWKQTLLNWDVPAPASDLSTGLFYAAGMVFSVSAGAILLVQLYRGLSGRASDEELISIRESEEDAEIDPAAAAGRGRRRA